jgi:hopanoid biosynthesis associated protein HpnK
MKQLLVTGDDFGLALEVNRAIERAHLEGILCTASLMVGAACADDAIARAHQMPELGVGLHVALVEGRPVLPPKRVPALVDAAGNFSERLVRASFRFFFDPRARRQLAAEIRAQFEAFAATGLVLDHVNAHNHLHVHPTILSLLLAIGRDYGNPPIRLPREIAVSRQFSLRDAALFPWLYFMQRRLGRAGVACNDQVFGLKDSGSMDEETLLALLERLPEGATEMYFHPAIGFCAEIERVSPGSAYQAEFKALVSPRVRARLDALGLEPIRFRGLASAGPVRP